MSDDAPKPEKVKSPDRPSRDDRLAERLRENLKKRKEQARAREKDEGETGV